MNTLKKRIDFSRASVKVNSKALLLPHELTDLLPDSALLDTLPTAIKQNMMISWATKGEWNMHQLLLSVLNCVGQSEVYISSYAFSETPARVLAQLKQEKVILKLYCLIDDRIDTRTPGSAQLVKSIADKCTFTQTHAKVTLLHNAEWKLTIVGSANYTDNKRWEAGYISTIPEYFDFHYSWLKNEIYESGN